MPIRFEIVRIAQTAFLFITSLFVSSALAQESEASFFINNSQRHEIASETLGRSYEVFVKTPAGYNDPENENITYPVIYLNDGSYTFQVASGVTHLPMGYSHRFERAILVGISYALGEKGMPSRVRDFTPVKDERWKKYETGGAPAYLKFLEEEVFPFVERNYRANPERRILSGQSLGGSFGVWVLFERPDLFSSYILTSPTLWYKDKFVFDLEKQFAKNHDDLKAKVYLAVGELETVENGMRNAMVAQLLELEEVLRGRNYPGLDMNVEVISGALHETTFPQAFTRGAHWILGR
ncbi:MAG: alpha/beta hydrolase-fold protein [Pseudomonadota bacterium]